MEIADVLIEIERPVETGPTAKAALGYKLASRLLRKT